MSIWQDEEQLWSHLITWFLSVGTADYSITRHNPLINNELFHITFPDIQEQLFKETPTLQHRQNYSSHERLVNVIVNISSAALVHPVQPIHGRSTLSLPRVINLKPLLQPHQKYYITQYEELGFSQLTQMKDDKTTDSHWDTYTFLLKDLGECNFLILGMKGLTLSLSRVINVTFP